VVLNPEPPINMVAPIDPLSGLKSVIPKVSPVSLNTNGPRNAATGSQYGIGPFGNGLQIPPESVATVTPHIRNRSVKVVPVKSTTPPVATFKVYGHGSLEASPMFN